MVIRASEKELDISGSPAELREIAFRITMISVGECVRFEADQTAHADPYDRLLAALEVVASDGAVKVSVLNDILERIRGWCSERRG